MQTLLRRSWFRLVMVATLLFCVATFYPYIDSDRLREGMTKALQTSTLLFAVCTALSLAVLNNYIKGLKDAAVKRISDIRSIVEKLYDEFHESDDPDLQEIVNRYLIPLLSFPTPQWLAFDPLKPVLEQIVEPLTRLHARNRELAPRYFLRLEDEINELGLLYVRRVISDLHAEVIYGSFLLICVGIIAIFVVAALPSGFYSNFIAVASATAIATLAILELLLLVSYLRQEAREEVPTYDPDDGEDNIDATSVVDET